jgi:hypothetical protein
MGVSGQRHAPAALYPFRSHWIAVVQVNKYLINIFIDQEVSREIQNILGKEGTYDCILN